MKKFILTITVITTTSILIIGSYLIIELGKEFEGLSKDALDFLKKENDELEEKIRMKYSNLSH